MLLFIFKKLTIKTRKSLDGQGSKTRVLKMNENFKIKCTLPAWYVFNCCMKSVKDLVKNQEEIEEWEELLEFLIDTDYFWECNVSFEEVIDDLIKNDKVRFIGVDELSKKGLEFYAKINEEADVDLVNGDGDYDLDDDNYITTLKNNTIVIWSF